MTAGWQLCKGLVEVEGKLVLTLFRQRLAVNSTTSLRPTNHCIDCSRISARPDLAHAHTSTKRSPLLLPVTRSENPSPAKTTHVIHVKYAVLYPARQRGLAEGVIPHSRTWRARGEERPPAANGRQYQRREDRAIRRDAQAVAMWQGRREKTVQVAIDCLR